MTPKKDLLERLADKFTVGDDCWLWHACRNTNGYGKVTHQGRTPYAHRLLYELLVGPIPEGLQIDHLCRVRHCVRPDHLEAVSQRENVRRSESFAGRLARQTHCIHGHEFTTENTYRRVSRPNQRQCRACWADDRERRRAMV